MSSSQDWMNAGWDHLNHQRPLAAWACWTRLLGDDPDRPAAREALDRLVEARDLPASARKSPAIRLPESPGPDSAWSGLIDEVDRLDWSTLLERLERLGAGSEAADLAQFDRGLVLAWQGRNAEAIAALDRAVNLAEQDRVGVDAWKLAEILRHGAGAEALADDCRYNLVLNWEPSSGPDPEAILDLLGSPDCLRSLPTPQEVGANLDEHNGPIALLDWLDRPMPRPQTIENQAPDPDPPIDNPRDWPRILGSLILSRGSLRISTPRLDFALEAGERLRFLTGAGGRPGLRSRSERTPLSLLLLDAAIWVFRYPEGLDETTQPLLVSRALASQFEDHWIHQPRHGLDSRSPLEAAVRARGGDPRSRRHLEAILEVREELADRPGMRSLYGDYPFARLRRRLGLVDPPPTTMPDDPNDWGCCGLDELTALDVESLDSEALGHAIRSALGLRHDPTVVRLADRLLDNDPEALATLGDSAREVVAALVRREYREAGSNMDRLDPLLEQAARLDPAHESTYQTWQAEIAARAGAFDRAASIAETLADRASTPSEAVSLLVEIAETILLEGSGVEAHRLRARAEALVDSEADRIRCDYLDRLGEPSKSDGP